MVVAGFSSLAVVLLAAPAAYYLSREEGRFASLTTSFFICILVKSPWSAA